MVIAHRGDSRTCPEQTIAAYTQAAERGAEMIEADVHRTRDGRLIMLHDATLDRTTSGSGPVAAIDHVELRTLDAGSWFSPDFAGERVPTLDELFDLAQRFDIALCLEVKSE
jgi:glycerophosphoryl diester phosphodiesterase